MPHLKPAKALDVMSDAACTSADVSLPSGACRRYAMLSNFPFAPNQPRCSLHVADQVTHQQLVPVMQICIRHCGTCQFRGVPEVQTVLQISRGALDGRVFPPGYANAKKAIAVGAAKGLQAVLVLGPQ